MSIPVPGDDARGLVSFRLFGIPVSIHTSFLVVAFIVGSVSDTGIDVEGALLWVGIITVSIVVHELGHALVARPARGDPRIDLFAMAGLTRWNAAHASRGRRVAVSFAGVGAGIVFGLALLVTYLAVDPVDGSLLEYAFFAALFANLGWGLFNLLPMLPLDGGQVVRALMPGRDDLTRDKRTAVVSAVVAVGTAVAAAATGYVAASFFVLFFGFGNLQTLVAIRRLRGAPRAQTDVERADTALHLNRPAEAIELMRPYDHAVARIITAAALLRLDRAREAQDLLLDLPGEVRIDPVFEAAVLLANGQDRLAHERLAVALRADPAPWATRELASVLHRRGEDVDAVLADVRGRAAAGVSAALFHEGAFVLSARWGERALGSGVEDPLVAYNVACAWARAGDADRGLRALDHAALLGFDDGGMADDDEDLAPLRAHPGWAVVRGRIG